MLKKWKQKWKIESNFQLVIILVIFSITGSAALIVRKGMFQLMGIGADTSMWIKVPLYVLIIFPAYQILLVLIAAIFGQFRFAWEFEKKMWSRIIRKK